MPPFIVFAIDALEYEKVVEFNCKNLMQNYYGKTNISEFSDARTMVLWSSFMSGKNKESEVLTDGKMENWNLKWDLSETFFQQFKSPVVLDLPGFSYNLDAHEQSRKLLKEYFTTEDEAKKPDILKEYNNDAFEHNKNVKAEFYKALDEEHDFILGYFSVIDVIGHLNFGKKVIMKILYKDMDDIYLDIKKKYPDSKILVLSDHGMKGVGMFGDHSSYGFWSTNWKDLGTPKITDMAKYISEAIEFPHPAYYLSVLELFYPDPGGLLGWI